MRLTELTLERYGAFAERQLSFPTTAGLTIIYGQNEAGKSTCLSALGDFLFGIPERTPNAALFGYEGMRLGATLMDADGTALTLRRRRGRGRTLTDADGGLVDEAVMARLLGATTRERFTSLFGLNHQTLRTGGERLLAADGEIGRLILEAGGGLRSLMARLDAIDTEADKLFAPRRSADRAFYKTLDAFNEADRRVKEHTITLDAYEQSRKAAEAAKARLADLRAEKQRLRAEISGLERLVRALPHMRALERLAAALEDYADLTALPPGFDQQVTRALEQRQAATSAHEEACARRDQLVQRYEALVVMQAFIDLEAQIRDLGEQALHVRKARADRSNRYKEIEAAEASLATLRRILHLPPEADLMSRLPSPSALERVQTLATEALERAGAMAGARERAGDLQDRLKTLERALEAARAAGHSLPAPFNASQFAGLPEAVARASAAKARAEQALGAVALEMEKLGFASLEALADFPCPSAEDIRAEQAARAEVETALQARLAEQVEAERKARAAHEEIERLQAAGPVATDGALAEARDLRTMAWSPLRAAFLDGALPAEPAVRRAQIDTYETHVRGSDDLADRRASEAQHAANLALARQQLAESKATSEASGRLILDLRERLERRMTAFADAFPDGARRFEHLAGLTLFAERRARVLEKAAAARALQEEADRLEMTLEPQLSVFAEARQAMQLPGASGPAFAVDVQAVCAALARHEAGHADYRRDVRDSEDLRPKAVRAEQELEAMRAAERTWQDEWKQALSSLGLDADLAPDRAGALISEWSGARATLAMIAQTRARLARMDEDEAALKAAAGQLGAALALALPEDPVAAAEQVLTRWREQEEIRLQRAALGPDVNAARADCARLATAEEAAHLAVAALCASAGVSDESALRASAARCAARDDLVQQRVMTERALADVGDGHDAVALQAQAAGRDLDMLRGALAAASERDLALETEIETALLEHKSTQDVLETYMSETGINLAIAERESAAADMQSTIQRYIELTVARAMITSAIERIRGEQQDPLVRRAGELFAFTTRDEFSGIETDIDDKGQPVVVGRRRSGAIVPVSSMSDGTRDQLFLAFRLASIENYAASAEPLPFVVDDILVHFDDERSAATLELLAEFGKTNQVLLFTHHQSVRNEAQRLEAQGTAAVVEITRLS